MTPQEVQREREAFDKWNYASDIATVTASRWSGWLARAHLEHDNVAKERETFEVKDGDETKAG